MGRSPRPPLARLRNPGERRLLAVPPGTDPAAARTLFRGRIPAARHHDRARKRAVGSGDTGCRPPEMGPWGRRTPPGDIEEWSKIVRQFATDLAAYLGGDASAIQFETGVEYDEKVSFDATADEFFRYYEATDRALHSVLPEAALSPGEFT